MNNRGASLNDLYPAVIALIIIGIVLGVGIYTLNETSEAVSNNLLTVSNETLNFSAADNALEVANVDECGFSELIVLTVTNYSSSTQAIIAASEYTVDTDRGTITNTTGTFEDEWNVSYTYRGSGEEDYCTSVETAITGVGGLASWIAVIIVVIAAGVVLGIVVSGFRKRTPGV